MMKRSRWIGAVLAFGLGLGYAANAYAQDQVWLQNRRYQEGMGIRTGDLELHPGVAGEFGYDSNYFLTSSDSRNSTQPRPSLRLRITPSLSVSTIGPQRREGEGNTGERPKVTFRANAAATYNEFFALKSQDSDAVSKQRNVGGLAGLTLNILPERPLGADLYGDFARTLQPSQNPDTNLNRISARFGAGLLWAPGGGMFDWRLGYEYSLVLFEDSQFNRLGTDQSQINTRGRWRFLPRTALLYDVSVGFLRYISSPPPAGRLDSNPVRARLGLNGLITQSFGVLAMAGWGSSFYRGQPNAEQYDGPIGQVELRWYITPNPGGLDPRAVSMTVSSIGVGYTRDFVNSYLSDYYSRDRFYLSGSYFTGGRFLLNADAGVALHGYSTPYQVDTREPYLTPPAGANAAPFKETRVDATLFGEYRMADSFGLNGTVRYSANLTDEAFRFPGSGDFYLSWNRFEAYVGLRWFL